MLLLMVRFDDELTLEEFVEDAELDDDEYAVVVMGEDRITVQ